MDIDEEDGTQKPKTVSDFGVEVDFDALEDEDREVCKLNGQGVYRSSTG